MVVRLNKFVNVTYIVLLIGKSGVSISSWSEGRIPKKKCSASRSVMEKKLTRATNYYLSNHIEFDENSKFYYF
jgi:hypothetical protein